jgi:hypothetical protein
MSVTREVIVGEIETALKTISVANGYHTALGSNVQAWLTRPFQQGELPSANIKDISDDTTETSLGADDTETDAAAETHELTIEIDIEASTGAIARQAIMDVRKALRDNVSHDRDILPVGDVVDAEQDEHKVVGATMTVKVKYYTSLWGEN